MLVDAPKDPLLGKSFDSGFRARESALSPASGVRSAQGMLLESGGGPLAGPRRKTLRPAAPDAPIPSAPRPEPLRPLRAPPARQAFESEFEVLETPAPLVRCSELPPASELFEPEAGSDLGLTPLTRVSAPDPSLLAIARGDEGTERTRRYKAKRLFWFVFGILVGTGIAFALANDVTAQVYRARVWAAGKLRSIHAHAEPAAPVASDVALDSAPAIPTVDVTQLPKARDQPPPPTLGAPPALTPPSPGAPALQHAPGPR